MTDSSTAALESRAENAQESAVGGGDDEEAAITEDRAEPAMVLMFKGGVMEGGVDRCGERREED